jgi:sugar phosphate isomerase/epimerase
MKSYLSLESSRREFLRRSALGAAGLSLVGTSLAQIPHSAAGKIPVGVQLYSVRAECGKDLPGTLTAIAKIGYRGVEFAGYHNRSAKDLLKMLDNLGLIACGTHTPYDSVQPAKLAETIEFNRTLGNKFLIVPWMTGKTKQDWLDRAKFFNDVAEKVKAEGMWVGYHAHAHDFEKLEGESAWDIFFGGTKADVVMQLDTSNCAEGGAEPVAVLKKYPGRAKSIHLKANGGGPEAVIGEDKVDWAGVFEFCENQGGTQWYVVEHESSKNPMDAIKRSFEALKKLNKV